MLNCFYYTIFLMTKEVFSYQRQNEVFLYQRSNEEKSIWPMFNFNKEGLKEKLSKITEPRILVIGDMIIDEMMYGDTERISREAPVIILQHTHTNIILGGAANAAHNIATLNGGKVGVIGLYGNDHYAPIMLEAFQKAGIDTSGMVQDKNGTTSVKTRISGCCFHSVTQQIIRIDRQTKEIMSKETEKQVIKNIKAALPQYDCIILSDYNIGFLTQNIINASIAAAKKCHKLIVVDAQKDLERFRGADALTPNQPDSERFVGYFIKNDETLARAGKDIMNAINANSVLITRGAEGMVIFEKSKPMQKIPVFNKKEVFDVTGAGDTVVASFALALAAGFTPVEAAIIGNLAASIVVKHFGCATTTVEELAEAIEMLPVSKKECGV